MSLLINFPSLFCRGYAHTTKQTPRQKWLRHIWLCPPATLNRTVETVIERMKIGMQKNKVEKKCISAWNATAANKRFTTTSAYPPQKNYKKQYLLC